MKKLLFIFNPYSGKAQLKNNLFEVVDLFVKAGYYVLTYPTQAPADTERVIKEIGAGFDRIVISGGDGTLDEAVRGVLFSEETKNIPIGYIPSGTTNDFANSLGISSNPLAAARTAVDGIVFDCDICTFNGNSFNYVAAFGAFTEVSYETPQENKNILGHLAYVIEAMKQLPNIKPHHVRVEYEGRIIEDDVILGLVLNTKSVGGFDNSLLDVSKLNDGLFEVILIKNPDNILKLPTTITELLQAKTEAQGYYVFQTSKMSIKTDNKVKWTLDGEFGGKCDFAQFGILPEAVKFIIPPSELGIISDDKKLITD